MQHSYDFIIIGGGSAGCAVAGRLSESGRHRVLLIEAGGSGRSPWIRVPLGTGMVFNDPTLNWRYESEPEPHLNNRRLYQPCGKGLGGTSAINGMIYCRGNRADYDAWRALGCAGWGYDDLLPFFKKAEDQERGADAYHGTGGPVAVSGPAAQHVLADAFLESAAQQGIPRNRDFNGATQEGAGYFQYTIKNGFRVTSKTAYLRAAGRRSNLAIITHALVEKIIFAGQRAAAVQFRKDGQSVIARSDKEVIVSAGTFNSVRLLQLSGVGPGGLLQRHGISPVADRQQVGQNYHDHFGLRIAYRCKEKVTLNDRVGTFWAKAQIAAQYALARKGPLASPGLPAGCFVRSHPALPAPDLELVLSLWTMVQGEKNKKRRVDPFSAFGMVIEDLHPDGRGTVAIRSPHADAAPAIVSNLFGSTRDRVVMTKAVRLARTLLQGAPLCRYTGIELAPGPAVQSDEQIVDYVRANGFALYHPVGTCRMGADEHSVVDLDLRVRGVEGLRIVDASIMPKITSGNINATVGMIAEKASAKLLCQWQ